MAWFGKKKAQQDDEAPPEVAPPQAPPKAAPAAAEAAPAAAPAAPANVPIDSVATRTTAGVQADGLARVNQARQLLRSMPQDGPSATKRQVVEAAFQAFEIPTQKISDGATAEIQALRAYVRGGAEDMAQKMAAGERRI